MERRSFLKGLATTTLTASTGGLIGANAFSDHSPLPGGDPYHFTKSLENTRQIPGLLLTFIATKKHTGGAFSILEGRGRKGAEPPLHVHQHEDEALYLLEGEMIVTIGDKDYQVQAGDFIFLPRKIPHTQKFISEEIHTLIFISPAGFEEYFWELTAPATSFEVPELSANPPSDEMIKMMMEMNAKYGISHPG